MQKNSIFIEKNEPHLRIKDCVEVQHSIFMQRGPVLVQDNSFVSISPLVLASQAKFQCRACGNTVISLCTASLRRRGENDAPGNIA